MRSVRSTLRRLVAAGGVCLSANVLAAGDLPSTVERLDAERQAIEAEQQATAEQAAAIRREASELERRRQEMLRALDAEAAALAKREEENAAAAAKQEAGLADRAAEIEHVLRAGGKWVSFAEKIAPLLRARCVACHSAREPGGGHVLTTYAGLFSEGANGPAVVEGDVDSLLCAVVADGSMPQDGEPLSPEEVDLIRRWVALGARLDQGANETAALVRIMPRPTQPVPPQHYPAPLPVSAVAFDPGGKRLASSGYHEALLWELPAGDSRATPQPVTHFQDVAERVLGLAFNGEGTQLAMAAGTPGVIGEATLLTLDANENEPAPAGSPLSLGLADDAFLAAAFSADGSRLATAAADHTVRVYDAATGEQIVERADHADWVQAVAISPDGSRLVSGSRDGTAKVVDLSANKLLITFSGHGEPVTTVCLLEEGKLIASGGADGVIRIWKAESGKEVRKIEGFQGSIEGLCLVADDRLAVADASGRVRLYQVADGKLVFTIEVSASPTTSLAASSDGSRLAVGSLDGSITVVSLAGETEPLRWTAVP